MLSSCNLRQLRRPSTHFERCFRCTGGCLSVSLRTMVHSSCQKNLLFSQVVMVRHTRSAPYHPATNGLAERFVQSFKQGLKISQSSGLPLNCRLSNYLFLYRSTPHSTTGVTPSSLFLQREMRTRFDLLRPDREAEVSRKQERQKRDHDRHSSARQFKVGDLVMVRNYRPGPDWVPATVVACLGPLSYLVETEQKQQKAC